MYVSLRIKVRGHLVMSIIQFVNLISVHFWGAMVTALASHQCGPGSIPKVDAICGLSLLLVLVPVPRVFLRVLRFSSLHKNPTFPNSNSAWKQWTKSHTGDEPLQFPLFIYFIIFLLIQSKNTTLRSDFKYITTCFENIQKNAVCSEIPS